MLLLVKQKQHDTMLLLPFLASGELTTLMADALHGKLRMLQVTINQSTGEFNQKYITQISMIFQIFTIFYSLEF